MDNGDCQMKPGLVWLLGFATVAAGSVQPVKPLTGSRPEDVEPRRGVGLRGRLPGVTSLLGPLPADQQLLLRAIADGYASAGTWPVWQYVLLTLNRSGYDADDLVRHLPVWPLSYRAAWWPGIGGMSAPEPGEPVSLTIYGMVHSGHPVMRDLASVHVAALRVASAHYLESEPSPTTVIPLLLDGDDLTRDANARAGTSLTAAELWQILSREPVTWSGLQDQGGSFTWDLAHSLVHRFRGVSNPQDYLARLSDFLGTALTSTPAPPLHATALPDALDRLDLVWQLVFGHHLWRILRAAIPVELTSSVADREDFSSRATAVAELLGTMTVLGKRKSVGDPLSLLLDTIQAKLPDDDVAADAARTLGHVRGVRHSFQHQAARAKYEADWRALDLDGFGDDWSSRWEHLRHLIVRALDTLSSRLLTEHDTEGLEGSSPSA